MPRDVFFDKRKCWDGGGRRLAKQGWCAGTKVSALGQKVRVFGWTTTTSEEWSGESAWTEVSEAGQSQRAWTKVSGVSGQPQAFWSG